MSLYPEYSSEPLNPQVPRILILDDHPLMLFALQKMISAEFTHATVLSFDSLAAAQQVLRSQQVDVLLLDLFLEHDQNGDPLTCFRAVQQEFSDLPIIVVTGNDTPHLESLVLNVGAAGFISKRDNGQQLCQTLRQLVPKLAQASTMPPVQSLVRLSGRRFEVLNLLAQGKSNKEISALLNISLHTVKSHVSIVLTSLRVASRTKAIRLIQQLDEESPGWRQKM